MHLLLTWIAIRSRVKCESTQIYKGVCNNKVLTPTSATPVIRDTVRDTVRYMVAGCILHSTDSTTSLQLCILYLYVFINYKQGIT